MTSNVSVQGFPISRNRNIYQSRTTFLTTTRMKGNALFNDALNTFYLLLYVSDSSDSKRRNPLPPLLGLLFLFSNTVRIAHTMAFIIPVVEHRLELEIALPRSYKSFLNNNNINNDDDDDDDDTE